ncbi:MAG: protein kinase domain-containing protein [Acidobacteriota bacterium]
MLAPGTRLSPYEIAAMVGAGGMGEVSRARDTRLDRVVAIKVMPAHVSADPAFRERFDREARTISTLSHPHICALYDVGSQDASSSSSWSTSRARRWRIGWPRARTCRSIRR